MSSAQKGTLLIGALSLIVASISLYFDWWSFLYLKNEVLKFHVGRHSDVKMHSFIKTEEITTYEFDFPKAYWWQNALKNSKGTQGTNENYRFGWSKDVWNTKTSKLNSDKGTQGTNENNIPGWNTDLWIANISKSNSPDKLGVPASGGLKEVKKVKVTPYERLTVYWNIILINESRRPVHLIDQNINIYDKSFDWNCSFEDINGRRVDWNTQVLGPGESFKTQLTLTTEIETRQFNIMKNNSPSKNIEVYLSWKSLSQTLYNETITLYLRFK